MTRVTRSQQPNRAWNKRTMRQSRIASDIAQSIHQREARGIPWAITEYTTNPETQRLVEALLSK